MEKQGIVEDENSEEATLKIVLDPSSPIKNKAASTDADVQLMETIEGEINKQLVKKAEKTNLTVNNVKSIIRQVLTNEHVLSLLHKEDRTNLPEPKLTRSKAKELLSSNPVQVSNSWAPPQPPSEIHVLVTEDLSEDSSGDEEYTPCDEEENDDSMTSESTNTSSLPPPTLPSAVCMEYNTSETNWTDDGVFKIPPCRSTPKKEHADVTNIALRTRSKINLSSTPLEVIEKSFIPPDITTDMYDMECDDEEWKEFLQGFTEPLELVMKPRDDEDYDPEYNILAEYDEIEKVDKIDRKEEFRDDKAVTITKKELKELWEELFEYLQNISDDYEKQDEQTDQAEHSTFLESSTLIANGKWDFSCQSRDESRDLQGATEDLNLGRSDLAVTQPEKTPSCSFLKHMEFSENTFPPSVAEEVIILDEQISILKQQIRQHIQILTQIFLLTYEHPEFHQYCSQLKEYLLNFKYLSQGKVRSVFKSVNLEPAVELVGYWIDMFKTNGSDVKACRLHVQRELKQSHRHFLAGNYNYIPTFPCLVLETISESEVFLYPDLLPKIPLKSVQIGSRRGFSDSEDRLLAFEIDHFTAFLEGQQQKQHKNKYGKVPLKVVISYVHQYVMPHRNETSILRHVQLSKDPRCANNPIRQYFLEKKLPKMIHYVCPIDAMMPPYKRAADELPTQLRNFLYPNKNFAPITSSNTETAEKHVNVETTCAEKLQKAKQKKSFKKLECSRKHSNLTNIEKFVSLFLTPVPLRKLIRNFLNRDLQLEMSSDNSAFLKQSKSGCKITESRSSMLPNISDSDTKASSNCILEETVSDNSVMPILPASCMITKFSESVPCSDPLVLKKHSKKNLVVRKDSRDFSYVCSSRFQQAHLSTEVEFCNVSNNFHISQRTLQETEDVEGNTMLVSQAEIIGLPEKKEVDAAKASTLGKQTAKKEKGPQPSRAEKRKAKLKREFLANLSVTIPEDPNGAKQKGDMFAFAFYDKMRKSLELEDYHNLMRILNDFESGDAVDLYKKVEPILKTKYHNLAEEFLLFLRDKEAAALGLLIPWIKINSRAKFLRKIEVCFKDHPNQLKKIYNALTELSESESVSIEKIKSCVLPLLKGNKILSELFLQNLMCERPPASVLQAPYETIDINKELARREGEDMYETVIVPNIGDKYGGHNCICHCHTIEDSLYKSRFKHCTSCGLRFVNGQVFVQSGRSMQPATVSFRTNAKTNQNSRLLGKLSMSTHHYPKNHKRKHDFGLNKQSGSGVKENLDEDTEDDDRSRQKKKGYSKTTSKT